MRWTGFAAVGMVVVACSADPTATEPTTAEPAAATPTPATVADPADEQVADPAAQPPTEAAAAGHVSFVSPVEGATVSSPLKVVMGISGMTVEKAGEVHAGHGHHHLLIDTDSIAEGTVVPSDAQHIHFGGGQTETEVELTPGSHKLTLQFADGLHRSYGPKWATSVSVVVQ